MGWGARFAGVLVAGAVLAGAVACGGPGPAGQALPVGQSVPAAVSSPSPGAAADDAAGPSASPEPEAEDPVLPDAATEHSADGAEAFVRFWIDTANRSFRTGDIRPWAALSESSCKSCNARMDDVRNTYAAGGRVEGGLLAVLDMRSTPVQADAVPLVSVDLKISPESHLDRSGRILHEDSGGKVTLVFFLRWDANAWLISGIKVGVRE